MILFCLVLSGCVDRTGYNVCRNSYDNLVLKEGYKILDHKSDFLCCIENHYEVIYLISYDNHSFWTNVFTYCSEDDRLIWVGNNGEWDLPEYIISIKN